MPSCAVAISKRRENLREGMMMMMMMMMGMANHQLHLAAGFLPQPLAAASQRRRLSNLSITFVSSLLFLADHQDDQILPVFPRFPHFGKNSQFQLNSRDMTNDRLSKLLSLIANNIWFLILDYSIPTHLHFAISRRYVSFDCLTWTLLWPICLLAFCFRAISPPLLFPIGGDFQSFPSVDRLGVTK